MNHIFGLTWWQFGLYILMSGMAWTLGCWIINRIVRG